jgi:hypothetical protein
MGPFQFRLSTLFWLTLLVALTFSLPVPGATSEYRDSQGRLLGTVGPNLWLNWQIAFRVIVFVGVLAIASVVARLRRTLKPN